MDALNCIERSAPAGDADSRSRYTKSPSSVDENVTSDICEPCSAGVGSTGRKTTLQLVSADARSS